MQSLFLQTYLPCLNPTPRSPPITRLKTSDRKYVFKLEWLRKNNSTYVMIIMMTFYSRSGVRFHSFHKKCFEAGIILAGLIVVIVMGTAINFFGHAVYTNILLLHSHENINT